LGASPDGICNRYKFDGVHKSKYVGRMLEIKCPLVRKINRSGPIKDHICPIYYWVQVQLQLECCDLEECDFWQCDLKEYKTKEDFIEDTDIDEPFRSKKFKFEKGCLIQLLPKDKMQKCCESKENYWNTVYEDAIFIYPPKIEMSPYDCDIWIANTLSELPYDPKYYNYYFDRVLWWRVEGSMNVLIKRDKEWFAESLVTFRKVWSYVEFLRNNSYQLDIFKRYIESNKNKKNDIIMEIVEKLCNPKMKDYNKFIKNLESTIDNNDIKLQQRLVTRKVAYTSNKSDIALTTFLFD